MANVVDMNACENGQHPYHYLVYGLRIASPFPCPELMPSTDGPVDLVVTEGNTPHHLEDATASGFKFEANREHVLIKTLRIADILISHGTQAIVQRKNGASDEEVRFLLLGWGLGAALHQRNILPLHASAVSLGNEAVAFCAPSGTGKSSTAALFVKQGYRLLDDNIAALGRVDSTYMVFPGSPTLKLPGDVVQKPGFAFNVGQCGQPVFSKYVVEVRKDFSAQPQPLRKIYVLTRREKPPFQLALLSGQAKFDALVKNIFVLRILRGIDNLAGLFYSLRTLASEVAVAEIPLPVAPASYEGLVGAIERDLAVRKVREELP